MIRTGGEHRISNFLLWQLAYTELYFTDCFWPDFGAAEFAAALATTRRASAASGAPGDLVAEAEARDAEAAGHHRTGVAALVLGVVLYAPVTAHRGAVRPAGAGRLGNGPRSPDSRRAAARWAMSRWSRWLLILVWRAWSGRTAGIVPRRSRACSAPCWAFWLLAALAVLAYPRGAVAWEAPRRARWYRAAGVGAARGSRLLSFARWLHGECLVISC